MEQEKSTEVVEKRTVLQNILRWTKRVCLTFLSLFALYLLICLIGLIPVNNDFKPSEDGIEILLISNPVHSDILLPITTETIDWNAKFPDEQFKGDTSAATHVAIGWGDRGFFIETPTWEDLKLTTATYALFWPSETCMHVTYCHGEAYREQARSVKISEEQYQKLVEFIEASFQHDSDTVLQIKDASYGQFDAFFQANGSYHCLNTCNSWVGRALQSSEVRTGWLTPLPKSMFLYLPEE